MKSAFHPKVTIVIPVYNGEVFMRYAIDSALAQTYDNVEILVINDGSKDNTESIAKEYGKRIRYIAKENGGVSSVLNMAIREMTGEWLSWLSHDDTYYPEKIEEQIRFIEEKSNIENIEYTSIITCCANDRIDTNGKNIARPVKYGKNYSDSIELLIDQIANYSIGGCCVLASKKAYDELGGFNEKNRTCSDAEMWYKMMLAGYRFIFDNKVLVHSRQHNGMVSVTRSELCVTEGTVLHEWVAREILRKRDDEITVKCLISALYKRGYPVVGKQYLSRLCTRDKVTLQISNTIYSVRKSVRGVLRIIYRKFFY